MDNPERIGVYGGTFDPMHKTHLDIAQAARQHGHLDKVLFVVAAMPPHKQHEVYATPQDRLAMVRAAVADAPDFDVSDLELRREGPSYTVDTLRELQHRHPDAELVLILGHDSLVDLPHWRDTDEILKMARVLSVPRTGTRREIPASLAGCYDELPFAPQETSSTEIRRQIAAGENFEAQVPPGVAVYIKEKGLYGYATHPK